MKMHFLSGGRVRMRMATYIPDADRSEMIELPVISALLRTAKATCCSTPAVIRRFPTTRRAGTAWKSS